MFQRLNEYYILAKWILYISRSAYFTKQYFGIKYNIIYAAK